jgi:hypothetical protein
VKVDKSASTIATAPGIAEELATVIQTARTRAVLQASSGH